MRKSPPAVPRRWPIAAAAAVLSVLFLLPAAALAQAGKAASPGADGRLDAVAKVIAGLPPTRADHAELTRRPAWREHSQAMETSWSRVRDGQLAALVKWRESEMPGGCPASRTLLYPFSGPDFINAYGLFPGCSHYVLFGLEPVGEAPDLLAMTDHQFSQYLAGLRTFMVNIFQRNYFVTGTMQKDFRGEKLRGVVPVLLTSMALSGVEVISVSPLRLERPPQQDKPVESGAEGQPKARPLRAVVVEFRSPGSKQVQRLTYFSLDASNAGLARHPEFAEYIRALGATTTLIKSASYLLHWGDFSRMRSLILDASVHLVQDDTGIPYSLLVKNGWQARVYGEYQVPIPPFERAFQPALAAAYRDGKALPLPFLFGYQLNDGVNRSNLIAARRAVNQTGSVQGTKLR